MTIQTIDTATDIGLKTGADKYNANFTDSANMASRLAQTSPTDATVGRGLTTDALGDNGGPIFTESNLNPNVFGGSTGGRKEGIANTASTCLFEFQVGFPAKASGITVTSTFSVVKSDGSAVTGGSSITPVLSLGTSNIGLAYIAVTGLSGLTVGENVFLVCDGAGSKITVNQ